MQLILLRLLRPDSDRPRVEPSRLKCLRSRFLLSTCSQLAGQDVTVSLWKICYETQTSDAGEESVGGAASDDKARELRDDNGRGIVTRNDKSVFALGRVSKNWISRAVDARRKVAAIDPFRHQELKLVLYAHANKEAEKAAPDAIVRFR